tara:strand:+ start:77 stop:325 length:249 start_codon:yes stop_codon:yes gene_type:complete
MNNYELTRDYLGLRDPKDVLPLNIEVSEDYGINHENTIFKATGQDGFYRVIKCDNVMSIDESNRIKDSLETQYTNYLNFKEV